MTLHVATAAKAKVEAGLRGAVESRLIDLKSLPPDLRRLALLGYTAVVVLVAAVLLCEVAGPLLPAIAFDGGERRFRVPLLALLISGAAFVTGWAYVVTGAALGGRLWGRLAAGAFLLQWLMLTGVVSDRGFAAYAVLIGAAAITGVLSRRKGSPPDASATWTGWLALGSALLGIAWLFEGQPGTFGGELDTLLTPLFIGVWPFLVLLGVELIDGGVQAARWTTGVLQQRTPGWLQRAALAIFLALTLTLAFVLGERWPESLPAHAASLLLATTGLLTLVALPVVLLRKWSPRTALLFLAVAIAAAPIGIGTGTAASKYEQLSRPAASGLLPQTFVFAAMLVFNCMNFGPRFANARAKGLPHASRTLLYFGALILFLAYALLRLNARDVATGAPDRDTQQITNALFFVGVLFIGPLYLAWTAWRRPDRLVSPDV
jgi:hypothetical protein